MMTPLHELTENDRRRGEARAHQINRRTLTPLSEFGHWRLFVTHSDSFDRIIVRTIRFIGIENDYARFEPGDLYIWEENEA